MCWIVLFKIQERKEMHTPAFVVVVMLFDIDVDVTVVALRGPFS